MCTGTMVGIGDHYVIRLSDDDKRRFTVVLEALLLEDDVVFKHLTTLREMRARLRRAHKASEEKGVPNG